MPQTRPRVFVVGLKSDAGLPAWEWPAPTHSEDALLAAKWVTGDYWREHGGPAPDGPPARLVERVTRMRPPPGRARWRTVRDGLRGLPPQAEPDARDVGARVIPGVNELDAPASTITTFWYRAQLREADGRRRFFAIPEVARL